MPEGPTVSNASPLIALTQLDQLALLPALYGEIRVPPDVTFETVRSVPRQAWLSEQVPNHPFDERVQHAAVDRGERMAIALALQVQARTILLDDRAGRLLAARLGLHVTGTLGVLYEARLRGLLPALTPVVKALLAHGFYASPELVSLLVSRAGE